jgi:hypothetical protein
MRDITGIIASFEGIRQDANSAHAAQDANAARANAGTASDSEPAAGDNAGRGIE